MAVVTARTLVDVVTVTMKIDAQMYVGILITAYRRVYVSKESDVIAKIVANLNPKPIGQPKL